MLTRNLLLVVALLAGCASDPLGENEIRYTALGASDAAGIGAIPPRRGYVFVIRDTLESRGKDLDFVNLGIPGAQIGSIKDALIAALLAHDKPTLVTLWTGANDLIGQADADEFAEELAVILQILRDQTEALVVVADLPDLTRIPKFIDDPDRDVTPARVRAFNKVIRDQANRFNVPVVDMERFEPIDELVSEIDGFHPNNRGHQLLADLFLEIVIAEID